MNTAATASDMSIRQANGITVIEFLDRRLVDGAQIAQLGDKLVAMATSAAQPRFLINFQRVEYLSSAAINILIALEKAVKKKAGQLRLCHLDAELLEVFRLLKLQKVMAIHATAEEAMQAFKG